VSPQAPRWFHDVVASLCSAYGVAWEIEASIAAVKPVF
jgi:hypothetical protein